MWSNSGIVGIMTYMCMGVGIIRNYGRVSHIGGSGRINVTLYIKKNRKLSLAKKKGKTHQSNQTRFRGRKEPCRGRKREVLRETRTCIWRFIVRRGARIC